MFTNEFTRIDPPKTEMAGLFIDLCQLIQKFRVNLGYLIFVTHEKAKYFYVVAEF